MMTLLWIMGGFALIVLASVISVILIVRAVYRRIRASRTVNGAVLRTRAALSWGAAHEVLRQRIRLAEAIDSAHAAMDVASRSDGPCGEIPRLFQRVRAEADRLDTELRFLESETDPAALATWLPLLRGRVETIVATVRTLRSAVAAGLDGLGADAVDELRADAERELAALHAGLTELHTLNANDRTFGQQRPRSAARIDARNHS